MFKERAAQIAHRPYREVLCTGPGKVDIINNVVKVCQDSSFSGRQTGITATLLNTQKLGQDDLLSEQAMPNSKTRNSTETRADQELYTDSARASGGNNPHRRCKRIYPSDSSHLCED